SYQGRKLSEWLVLYTDNPLMRDQATNAVHHIGTNALPLLIKWMSYKMSSWRRTFSSYATWIGGEPLMRIAAGSAAAQADIARTGFEILGPEGAPAVPALTNLLADWDWKSRATFERAVLALNYIGNDGLAPLVSVVTNKSAPADFRWTAAARISDPMMKLNTNANWVVPVLAVYLNDNQVARPITAVLGSLRLEPTVAVPALRQCLQNEQNDYGVLQAEVANSLGRFGKDAVSAVPDLIHALGSTKRKLRIAATNALETIAPEVLKKP